MSDHSTLPVKKSDFYSLAAPTPEDEKRWNELSAEEQRALTRLLLDEAEESGPALSTDLEDLIARVRASKR